MPLPAFRSDHDQMIAIARSILGSAAKPHDDALAMLQASRIELSRIVASHCAAEIAHLRSISAASNSSAEKQALLRRYHSDLLAWRGALMECNASWPTRRIAGDRQAFRTVFGSIVDRLIARVRWEEREFYPAIFGRSAAR